MRKIVSLQALDILVGELHRLNGQHLDSSNCGCILRYSCGLPCACMLSEYLNSGECIQLDSIDVFWKKLDISKTIPVENEDINCDEDLEMFKENFTQQSGAVKKSFLRKLRDIFQPSKTLMKEPAVQKNTRGRPSLKKQQQKQVDSLNQSSRRRSFSTMSKSVSFESRHSSFVTEIPDLNEEPLPDLNEEPQSCYNHPLMYQIPAMFHPYITHIQNVKGDENCGFRAIAFALGFGEDGWLYIRQQLLAEFWSEYDAYERVFTSGIDELRISLSFLKASAPPEHWMLMPETGFLIANKFGVIVTFISGYGSVTCFPLWKAPEEFPNHRNIAVSLVNNNHYVMVKLEGDYPMPTISPYWIRHRAPCAAGWQTMYTSRLELYRQLRPYNPQAPTVTIEDDFYPEC